MNEQQHRLAEATGDVIGSDGRPIGSITSYYLDDRTGEPNWVRVDTAGLGRADGIIPAHEAQARGTDLHVPYTREQVAGAPTVPDVDGHLAPEQEREIYRHYGQDFDQVRGGAAGAALTTDEPRSDIDDVSTGHNPLRTDAATHDEGELRPGGDEDGEPFLTTRG